MMRKVDDGMLRSRERATCIARNARLVLGPQDSQHVLVWFRGLPMI